MEIKSSVKLAEYTSWLIGGSADHLVFPTTLEELKEVLANKYRAKQLIPIVYTPWDSKDIKIKQACKLENLTMLYLYENQEFEVSKY